MRSKKSILNAVISVSMQVLLVFFQFYCRKIFISTLGKQYLGIQGLFTNILTLLSIADMGVGSAIIYSMYKPMAEDNYDKINILVHLFAKIYYIIGFFVILIGLGLLPFLKFIINTKDLSLDVYLIYAIYVFNSGISYFFVYKTSLLNVAQQSYIVAMNSFIFTVLMNITQIICLLIYRNYVLYCLIMLLFTLISNISISIISEKRFPFIKNKPHGQLSKSEEQTIKKNCSALLFHKVGDVVVNGTDNILITRFIDISMAGVYSNYSLIVSNVLRLFNLAFSSVTSSIGNFVASKSSDEAYKLYKIFIFINSFFAGFCGSSLFNLINPFINEWVGREYLLDTFEVLLIVLIFYIQSTRETSIVFKSAYGLYWNDRFKPLIEAAINLAVSVYLGKQLGLIGILIGTIVSLLLCCFIVEPYILYTNVFSKEVSSYIILFAKYFFVNVMGTIVGNRLILLNPYHGIYGLMIDFAVSILIWFVIFMLFFYNSEESKWILDKIKTIINDRRYNICNIRNR